MANKPLLRKLKRVLIVLLMVVVVFAAYVEIVNRNSKNMNYRQKVLKAVYPVLMWWTKVTGKIPRHWLNKLFSPRYHFIR